jgi:hypothetical protein
MKIVNLVIAILYTVFYTTFLVVATIKALTQNNPYQLVGSVYLVGPVVLNWMSFGAWDNRSSNVRITNLIIAILYTAIFCVIFAMGLMRGQGNLLGFSVFSVPVVLNWLSFFNWPLRQK